MAFQVSTEQEVAGNGRLRALSRLAIETGSRALAAEAESLAERLREGRFYVVCVGQFKRGKSTLVNALVGEPVLPAGVAPVTTLVTVVRHGERLGARVRFQDGEWRDCDPRALSPYVSEEENPGNEKGVTGIEVFVPSGLLASGLCLVDTPGIGSVFAANTATTRAFVPHMDAALVVLGADPPISGEELALIREVAGEIEDLIFVLNKADRHSDRERGEVLRFTERVLGEGLGRPVGPILQVSAAERLAGSGPPREWEALVRALESLAGQSGTDLVRAAETRGVTLLAERLLRELDEQRSALLRPVEESASRIDLLHRAVAEAERLLADLGHLLAAERERFSRRFMGERDRFFARALPDALSELRAAIGAERLNGPALRRRAIDHASEVTKRWLDRWRREQEPRAERLYREATARFVDLANGFQERLAAVPGLEGLPRLAPEAGFRAKSRFHFTEMLADAPSSPVKWLLDAVSARRSRAIERDASTHLERLLEVNSARIQNDFRDRVDESQRRLEKEMRDRLRELCESAERALEGARQAQAAGAAAVNAALGRIQAHRSRAEALGSPRRSPGQGTGRPGYGIQAL